jgi:hypothetical protein
MNDGTNHVAECLCGKVTLQADAVERKFTACHCGQCCQWGGVWLAAACGSEVVITGQENLSLYDSSAWAERGFCSQCGTHMFYRTKQDQLHFVPVALFKGIVDFKMDRQIFFDKKPEYYCFSNDTVKFTEQEMFEQFSS